MAKILIVDDDPDILDASRLVLERAGHTVITASNPRDGELALERESPALLILDIMMDSPDDGLVMAQTLRRTDHKLPILMLTSLPRVSGMSLAKDDEMVPVDELVEKPVSPERLTGLVTKLLGMRR
jgi:DNA-binding response OmpR family regulator